MGSEFLPREPAVAIRRKHSGRKAYQDADLYTTTTTNNNYNHTNNIDNNKHNNNKHDNNSNRNKQLFQHWSNKQPKPSLQALRLFLFRFKVEVIIGTPSAGSLSGQKQHIVMTDNSMISTYFFRNAQVRALDDRA